MFVPFLCVCWIDLVSSIKTRDRNVLLNIFLRFINYKNERKEALLIMIVNEISRNKAITINLVHADHFIFIFLSSSY